MAVKSRKSSGFVIYSYFRDNAFRARDAKLWATIPDKTTWESFPIMSTFLHNKTISQTTPLRKEIPFPQFNVASYKRPGIRLSFWIHNNIAFRGRRRVKNWYSYDVQKNAPQVHNFLISFVQDCRYVKGVPFVNRRYAKGVPVCHECI